MKGFHIYDLRRVGGNYSENKIVISLSLIKKFIESGKNYDRTFQFFNIKSKKMTPYSHSMIVSI